MPLKPRARQQNRVERQLSKIVTKDAYDTNFGGASAPLSTPLSTALVSVSGVVYIAVVVRQCGFLDC